MDQGIGVDHLDRGHKGIEHGLILPAKEFKRALHKEGPEPLAACHEAVLHSLIDCLLIAFLPGKSVQQHLIDLLYLLL